MTTLIVLFLCCAGMLVSSAPEGKKVYYDLDLADHYFDSFVREYNKVYSSEVEKAKRFQIFKQQLETINQKNSNKDEHAEFGINQFSDMTPEEFRHVLGCKDIEQAIPCQKQATLKNVTVPDKFDWRDKNKVTEVKNQGLCGSCWSFSTTGTLEGQYAIKHNVLKEFSEQQLVDCDKTNSGCNGGWMSNALLYLKENGAILESDYPYTATDGLCSFDKTQVAAKVTECYSHTPQTEDELMQALVQYGPLAIGIDSTDVQKYKRGILTDCRSSAVDHGVLLVGYGTENGIPYWTIKNSWGSGWGEKGYFRVKRNINACYIMSPNTVSPEVA